MSFTFTSVGGATSFLNFNHCERVSANVSMDSTKIEHLLKNYKVADIIQIQKGLKTDVEKKKTDLKNLIGYVECLLCLSLAN